MVNDVKDGGYLKAENTMGLPNLTPEEEYLLKKFALLKRKV